MMTASKRILAAMSAIGVAATLASCQAAGRFGGERGGCVGAGVRVASKSAQAGGRRSWRGH